MKRLPFFIIIIAVCLSNACSLLSREEPINPKDYPFLLLAEDLQAYKIKLDLSGRAEKARIKKWINGSRDIKYEYDCRDRDAFHPLFFSAKLEIDKDIREAKKAFQEGIVVITKVSATVGMQCREIEGQVTWGDESYYAIREKKGNPVGLIFVARYQNKVYTLIMAGLYSSDHSLLRDIVLPKLRYVKDFSG